MGKFRADGELMTLEQVPRYGIEGLATCSLPNKEEVVVVVVVVVVAAAAAAVVVVVVVAVAVAVVTVLLLPFPVFNSLQHVMVARAHEL